MSVIEFLTKFGAKKGATPAQIALACLMARKPWIVPIPSTGNIDHLRENMGSGIFTWTWRPPGRAVTKFLGKQGTVI